MGKLLLAVAVAVASFLVAESLVCNKCTFGLLGYCMNPANETCKDGNSTCFTSVSTFPSLSAFKGFNIQGCADNNTGCGKITNFTFLGAEYDINYACCNTDRCNTVVSAAPAGGMALSAAAAFSILAVMFSI